jgi:hypothetical protein
MWLNFVLGFTVLFLICLIGKKPVKVEGLFGFVILFMVSYGIGYLLTHTIIHV